MGSWKASLSASTFLSRGAFGILFAIPDRLRALRLCFLMFFWVYVFGRVSANVLNYCHRLSFTLMLYLLYLQWLLSVMHGVGCSWGVVCNVTRCKTLSMCWEAHTCIPLVLRYIFWCQALVDARHRGFAGTRWFCSCGTMYAFRQFVSDACLF